MPQGTNTEQTTKEAYLQSEKCKKLREKIIQGAKDNPAIADAMQEAYEYRHDRYTNKLDVKYIFEKVYESFLEIPISNVAGYIEDTSKYTKQEICDAFLGIDFKNEIAPYTTYARNLDCVYNKLCELGEVASYLFSSCGAQQAEPTRNRDSEQPVVGPATVRLTGSRKPPGNGMVF